MTYLIFIRCFYLFPSKKELYKITLVQIAKFSLKQKQKQKK